MEPDKREIKAKKNPTSFEVARLAGVSQSTVSRVFNKKWDNRISEKTRLRVKEVAEQVGYNPNAIARSLTSRKTGIIGIVMSDQFNIFYYEILSKLTNRLQAEGMRTMVFNTAPDHNIDQILSRLLEYQVDGVIVTSSALTNQITGRWLDRAPPLVLLNSYSSNIECNTVYSDNAWACRKVAHYLVETGHTRIAYVSTSNSLYSNHEIRQNSFLMGLRELGIHQCRIAPGDYSYLSGKEAAAELLGGEEKPDAVFCANDRMAMGVIDAARHTFGLRVPEDVSIVGYDDTEAASQDAYQLTAVRQMTDMMVEDAAGLLLASMEDPALPPRKICEPMEFIVRGSTMDRTV